MTAKRLIPCADATLLDAEHFDLALDTWKHNPEDPGYLAARQLIALALVEEVNRMSTTDPDKHGSLANASGAVETLSRLLGKFHQVSAPQKKKPRSIIGD